MHFIDIDVHCIHCEGELFHITFTHQHGSPSVNDLTHVISQEIFRLSYFMSTGQSLWPWCLSWQKDLLDASNHHRRSSLMQLGKDVFNDAKTIMLDDSYQDELFNQIHIFFAGIENNMHTLMSTT